MKKFALAYILGLVAAGAAAPALADDDRHYNRDGWMNVEQISSHLHGLGYSAIREIDTDDGLYEVEAKSPEGRFVELKVNPKTGDVLHSELDD